MVAIGGVKEESSSTWNLEKFDSIRRLRFGY